MFSNKLFRSFVVYFSLVVGMLAFGIFINVQFTNQVEAASISAPAHLLANQTAFSDMPTKTDGTKSYTCNVGDVQNDLNLVALGCATPDGAIKYFAMPLADSHRVNRSMSIWLTALSTGKQVLVVYNPDDTTSLPPGCNAVNCRVVLETVIFN